MKKKRKIIEIREINGTTIWSSWYPARVPKYKLYRPFAHDLIANTFFFRSIGKKRAILELHESRLYTKYFRPFVLDTKKITYYPIDSL